MAYRALGQGKKREKKRTRRLVGCEVYIFGVMGPCVSTQFFLSLAISVTAQFCR